MRWLLHGTWLLFALSACKEPVGAKIPRPNKKAAAGITAAVAGAMTIANPKLAGRKPESANAKRPRPTKVKESVPSGVLDRVDDKKKAGGTKPPCPAKTKKSKTDDGDKPAYLPKQTTTKVNGIHMRDPCKPAKPAPTKKPKPGSKR